MTGQNPKPDEYVMLDHDNIFSSRSHVNVLWPYGFLHNEMNHHFSPVNRRKSVNYGHGLKVKQTIHDYLKECVMDVITESNPGWSSRVKDITIRPDHNERGRYVWVAWGVKE